MRRGVRLPLVVAACVVVLLVGALFIGASGTLGTPSAASSDVTPPASLSATSHPPPAPEPAPVPSISTDVQKASGFSFAVVGDIPYGSEQLASLPAWVDQINAAQPALTFHVGDIKNGSTRCDDEYYATIRAQFDRFTSPLIYTPGDNEWAECHRPANGAYNPLDRLGHVRTTFFDHPGTTMGSVTTEVESQADAGFPENVTLRREGVDFAVVHLVGANDDLEPWAGLGYDRAIREQVAEEDARLVNAIDVIESTFAAARQHHDRAVVLLEHVDLFSPTLIPKGDTIDSPFTPLVQVLIDQASTFDGPVYLINGDTHHYNSDRPLAASSRWLTIYGVNGSADNLQRVTVDGSSSSKDWLQVTVNPLGAAAVVSWERVPYTGNATPT